MALTSLHHLLAGPYRQHGRAAAVHTQAHLTPHHSVLASYNAEQHHERVLRYPDGKERRIRYPAEPDEADWRDVTAESANDLECWGADVYYGLEWESEEDLDVQQTQQEERAHSSQGTSSSAVADVPAELQQGPLPGTAADLVRYVSSDAFRQRQAELWDRVRASYEVLEGSPWVQSRAIYLLATWQKEADTYLTYSLRTRINRPAAEDELSKVPQIVLKSRKAQLLKRKRPDGGSVVRVDAVCDGVVAFQSEAEAQRFGASLQEEGVQDVIVAQCQSHEIFRQLSALGAVAVLLNQGCEHPQPSQLATALRAQRSLEDL